MKSVSPHMILVLFLGCVGCHTFGQTSPATLKGPYLGQKPPGLKPEPFAPGIVTTDRWEYCITFTPELDAFYLLKENAVTQKDEFVMFAFAGGHWRQSVVSERVGQPFIAPDGRTMHLGRRFMTRTKDGWSDIKTLDAAFMPIKIMRLTVSTKGTYVFDDLGAENGRGMIRYSRLVNGIREQPTKFGKAVNSGRANAHPFIAADESFLLWDSRRESGYGQADMYVCFKQKDGSWGEAVNMGEAVNSDASEFCGSVSPDGKYLFFHRSRSKGTADIMWVDAKILDNLRPN